MWKIVWNKLKPLSCVLGYNGSRCEKLVESSVCYNSPCRNGGTCYNTLTSDLSQYRRDCQLGYMGKFISPWQHVAPATTPWPLTSHSIDVTASWDTWVSSYHHDNMGTCYITLTSDLSQYRCDCQLGYMGKFISPWQQGHLLQHPDLWPLTV